MGVSAIILFGLPESKDKVATGAWAEDGIVQRAARAIKSEVPGLLILGDVCLCEYMSHGHCGVIRHSSNAKIRRAAAMNSLAVAVEPQQKVKAIEAFAAAAAARFAGPDFEILNDATLELLARTAVSQVQAGVDIVAPSDMMDGRVAAIRKALDQAGLSNTPSFLMPPNLRPASTGRFGRLQTRRLSLAIVGLTRWMAPTCARPCARLSRI